MIWVEGGDRGGQLVYVDDLKRLLRWRIPTPDTF